MIFAQINLTSLEIEQFVGFSGGTESDQYILHVENNPQAFFVPADELGSRKTHRYEVETGTIVKLPVVMVAPVKPSRELRKEAYPPIGDQLDALYKAMRDGLIPLIPEFFNPIDDVKRRIPKDLAPPSNSLGVCGTGGPNEP